MMSMPSASRSTAHGGAADGTGANGSTASTARVGHRQGPSISRASIAPSDSVSQAGGMSASRSTNKVCTWCGGQRTDKQRQSTMKPISEGPSSSHHASRDPEYLKLGINA